MAQRHWRPLSSGSLTRISTPFSNSSLTATIAARWRCFRFARAKAKTRNSPNKPTSRHCAEKQSRHTACKFSRWLRFNMFSDLHQPSGKQVRGIGQTDAFVEQPENWLVDACGERRSPAPDSCSGHRPVMRRGVRDVVGRRPVALGLEHSCYLRKTFPPSAHQ